MNIQNERRRKGPSRKVHRPERRQAPHGRSPSSKEAVQDEINRPQTESRGRKPLPVAQPVRSAARTSEGRPRGSHVPRRTTAATPTETRTPGRSGPRGVQVDVRMAFTLFGFSVAAVLIILFGLDLVMAVPFQRISMMMDVTYLICGIILAGLSWSCLRDLR